MRTLLVALSFAALAAAADRKPSRAVLKDAENRFDALVQRQWADDPLVLLGSSRALYVEGVGVIVAAEINLVTGPTVSPFNPTISKEAIARHRAKKLERMPQLRKLIQSGAEASRSWFPDLADNEKIILGVVLLKYSWEDPAGMPSQIIAVTGRSATSPVKMQEN